MSIFVNNIIEDLKNNPTEWKFIGELHGTNTIQKGDIKLANYGTTRFTSLVEVRMKKKLHETGTEIWYEMPTTYSDRWKLEVELGNWFKTVKLETLLK